MKTFLLFFLCASVFSISYPQIIEPTLIYDDDFVKFKIVEPYENQNYRSIIYKSILDEKNISYTDVLISMAKTKDCPFKLKFNMEFYLPEPYDFVTHKAYSFSKELQSALQLYFYHYNNLWSYSIINQKVVFVHIKNDQANNSKAIYIVPNFEGNTPLNIKVHAYGYFHGHVVLFTNNDPVNFKSKKRTKNVSRIIKKTMFGLSPYLDGGIFHGRVNEHAPPMAFGFKEGILYEYILGRNFLYDYKMK